MEQFNSVEDPTQEVIQFLQDNQELIQDTMLDEYDLYANQLESNHLPFRMISHLCRSVNAAYLKLKISTNLQKLASLFIQYDYHFDKDRQQIVQEMFLMEQYYDEFQLNRHKVDINQAHELCKNQVTLRGIWHHSNKFVITTTLINEAITTELYQRQLQLLLSIFNHIQRKLKYN